jgi:hypothetical protein
MRTYGIENNLFAQNSSNNIFQPSGYQPSGYQPTINHGQRDPKNFGSNKGLFRSLRLDTIKLKEEDVHYGSSITQLPEYMNTVHK